ncbi:hypothetical protein Y032_0003g1435 [Ancylostoma ceylanicum]|nr:hypothetical protein Y032_0003g1435 [Ancylostoma ceylanicum]
MQNPRRSHAKPMRFRIDAHTKPTKNPRFSRIDAKPMHTDERHEPAMSDSKSHLSDQISPEQCEQNAMPISFRHSDGFSG